MDGSSRRAFAAAVCSNTQICYRNGMPIVYDFLGSGGVFPNHRIIENLAAPMTMP
jgi:hypothetical protein